MIEAIAANPGAHALAVVVVLACLWLAWQFVRGEPR